MQLNFASQTTHESYVTPKNKSFIPHIQNLGEAEIISIQDLVWRIDSHVLKTRLLKMKEFFFHWQLLIPI